MTNVMSHSLNVSAAFVSSTLQHMLNVGPQTKRSTCSSPTRIDDFPTTRRVAMPCGRAPGLGGRSRYTAGGRREEAFEASEAFVLLVWDNQPTED